MKNLLLYCLVLLSTTWACAQQEKEMKLETEIQKVSYGIGLDIAENLKRGGLEDIDPLILSKAIQDVFGDKEPLIPVAEAQNAVKQYITLKQNKAGSAALEMGRQFLAENKKREGVVELPSGLQYEILKEGNGPKPTINSKVTTHYHGTLIDGTVFDSSVKRGQPASFPVSGVIKGWTEALQLMPTGSKWRLFVPSNLAYGSRGAGGAIGPNETLIFDVELLSIN